MRITSTLQIGELSVIVHRTVRVPEGRTPASLPPSRGSCEMYQVSDFDCPEAWEKDGVFIGLHRQEAVWLSFRQPRPVAIVLGAGGVNALTGKPLSVELAEGAYMVAPPQPWIDGWKDASTSSVFQFVATEFKSGEGLSVGEQLLGEESKSGGIGIAVFESNEPLKPKARPAEIGGLGMYGEPMKTMSVQSLGGGMRGMSLGGHEMGVGKGGMIKQRIYPDPHGIEAWSDSAAATGAIYLINAQAFHEITGEALAPSPIASTEYSGQYFDLEDEDLGDTAGSEKFVGLKSVFAG